MFLPPRIQHQMQKRLENNWISFLPTILPLQWRIQITSTKKLRFWTVWKISLLLFKILFCKIKAAKTVKLENVMSKISRVGVLWLLGIMIFATPGCHPVLLLHVIPAAVARPGRPLIPFDTNSVVTGNRGFVLGSLEKAALRRRRSREEKWVYFKL